MLNNWVAPRRKELQSGTCPCKEVRAQVFARPKQGRGVRRGRIAVRLVTSRSRVSPKLGSAVSEKLPYIRNSFYIRMTRIFLTLSSLSLALLIIALVQGFSIGNLYERPEPSAETLRAATFHRLIGIAAALAVVFVESIVVTYFIGTSRWCKEVVETYQLGPEAVAESNRLKRRTFPWALAGMLAVVVVIALGGAADPATLRPNTQDWASWHRVGALVGIVFVAWTYWVSWNNIAANHAIIERVMAGVERFRRERE